MTQRHIVQLPNARSRYGAYGDARLIPGGDFLLILANGKLEVRQVHAGRGVPLKGSSSRQSLYWKDSDPLFKKGMVLDFAFQVAEEGRALMIAAPILLRFRMTRTERDVLYV